MLRCFFIRKKLYDYLDNSLSEIDKINVDKHLNYCVNCKNNLEQLRTILDLTAQKKSPQPTEEFWHNFKVDLDRRLNQKLIPPPAFGWSLNYSLKPVMAYALVLVFIVALGGYFYKNHSSVRLSVVSDDALINEIVALEEIGQALELSQDKDAYIDEINLLYQFEQNLS